MQEYQDQTIEIGPKTVKIRINGSDYDGDHSLKDKTLTTLAELRAGSPPAQYGAELFQACFQGRALEGYHLIRSAIERGEWKRLRLSIDPKANYLHTLWWESLWDLDDPPRRLGCSTWTPLSRYFPLAANREPVQAEKLRVLAVISNPIDLGPEGEWSGWDPLDEEAEIEAINSALENLDDRVVVEYQNKPASRMRIREQLKAGKFNVLHIVAHGGFSENREQGFLLLEKDDDETVEAIDERYLAQMVEDLIDLRLVVLAACHSAKSSQADALVGLAPRLIRAGVPAVIAMQEVVSMETARSFTEYFYGSLGKSVMTRGLVDVAINNARDALFFRTREEVWDWAIPVLFMRGDGRLFEPKEQKVSGSIRPHQPRPVERLAPEPKAGLRDDTPMDWAGTKPGHRAPILAVVKIAIPPFSFQGKGDDQELNYHTILFHGKFQEKLTKIPWLQIMDPESAAAEISLSGELSYFDDQILVAIHGKDARGALWVTITKPGKLDQLDDLLDRCVEGITNQLVQRVLPGAQWRS